MHVDELWSELEPNADGLVAAVIVDDEAGDVRMLGYMSRAALGATLERGRVVFFSRSRRALWEKGETSGNSLEVASIRVDCDGDALWIAVRPKGPTCHTGARSCFFRRVEHEGLWADDGPPAPSGGESKTQDPDPVAALFATIEDRKHGRGVTNAEGQSYVKMLLDRGSGKINEKIAEETAELCRAIRRESDERVAAEAADLVFHVLVGLAHRGLDWADVQRTLAERAGVSGVDEKNARGVDPDRD